MKKIVSLFILVSSILFYNSGISLNANTDGSAFDPFKGSNFPIVNNVTVKKLDSTIGNSSTVTLISNAEKPLGKFGADYEYYLIDNIVEYDYIIVLYRITLNPFDKVKYKNGLGGIFTETGDAFVKSVSVESTQLNTLNTLLVDYGPKADLIQYTESHSISLTPVTITDQSGYSSVIFVPSYTYTITSQTQSVVIDDQTEGGIVKTNFLFKKDAYSKGTSYQYGYYFFQIPYNQKQINLNDIVNVKMSVGGSWGVSSDTGIITYSKQLSWT